MNCTLKAKILIVEDDETVRDFLIEFFSYNGYDAKAVNSVKAASDLLLKEYFPVIITDLVLPDKNGIELLNFVKEQEINSAVLVVTAYRSIDSVIQALRLGAYDYITKPFEPQILLHRVSRAFEKIRMEAITKDLSSRIVYATEEERQRISRDIHDGIGQSLAIIKLTLRAIKNKLLSNEEDVLQEIEGLSSFVEETMEEISRIIKALNPSSVREVGLNHALRLYAETFVNKTGIGVDLKFPETLVIHDEEIETHLYRIAQEALANVAKHSGATQVIMELRLKDRVLEFTISDNGHGFNMGNEEREGLGIIGMKERAFLMGGQVTIESVPDGVLQCEWRYLMSQDYNEQKINVLIVDDHALFRQGLRRILESRKKFVILGEASDGDEAFRMAKKLQPHIIIMDITMPYSNGLEATQRIKRLFPHIHVLLLTMHEDPFIVEEGLKVGASGYIVKKAVDRELFEAIDKILRGEVHIPSFSQHDKKIASYAYKNLSAREQEILRLLAGGMTNKDISEFLGISINTVETHRKNFMKKLNLHSLSDIIKYAIIHGLIPPSSSFPKR